MGADFFFKGRGVWCRGVGVERYRGGGGRKMKRKTDRQRTPRETHTDRERHTESDTERETERETHTERQREIQRKRHLHRACTENNRARRPCKENKNCTS